MEQLLNYVAFSVAALFLGELAIGLLPEGSMKKFCKFILGILLVFMVLGVIGPGSIPNLEVDLPWESQSVEVEGRTYEDLILDVYHREMENKNK